MGGHWTMKNDFTKQIQTHVHCMYYFYISRPLCTTTTTTQQNGHHPRPRESTTSHDESVSLSSLSQPASSHSQKSLVNKTSPGVVSFCQHTVLNKSEKSTTIWGNCLTTKAKIFEGAMHVVMHRWRGKKYQKTLILVFEVHTHLLC